MESTSGLSSPCPHSPGHFSSCHLSSPFPIRSLASQEKTSRPIWSDSLSSLNGLAIFPKTTISRYSPSCWHKFLRLVKGGDESSMFSQTRSYTGQASPWTHGIPETFHLSGEQSETWGWWGRCLRCPPSTSSVLVQNDNVKLSAFRMHDFLNSTFHIPTCGYSSQLTAFSPCWDRL